MNKWVVIDTSTLILLAKVTMLDLLLEQVNITVPEMVSKEALVKREDTDAQLISQRINENKIRIQIAGELVSRKMKQDFNLGEGEAEALALCLEHQYPLITDDKRAMTAGKVFNIEFITALNLLVLFYKNKLVSLEEAKAKLEKLGQLGRYSEKLLDTADGELK